MKSFGGVANRVVKFTGMLIFAWLTWHSLRSTYLCIPGQAEVPTVVKDVVWKQLIFMGLTAAVWMFLFSLEKRLSRNTRQLISGLSVIAAVVWTAGAGFYWIGSIARVPTGDCAFVYGGASYFIEGNYALLRTPGGYFDFYPHQLALTAMMEALFRIVGPYRFDYYEYICVLAAAGVVFAGYLILREVSDSMTAAVIYCLTVMGCLPLVLYTSWVYGDLPSIFFTMTAAWTLLRYSRTGRRGWLAGLVFSVTMAVLVRKNSVILLAALCLTALVCLIVRRDVKLFIAAACAAVLPFLIYQGVYKMYEVRSGYEHSRGLPVITWVGMGLDENDDGSYGWYNDYWKRMYIDQDFDRERTRQAALDYIARRLEVFGDNKGYAAVFFREKILSQWNAPLYQSVYFNTNYDWESPYDEDSLPIRLQEEYFPKVLAFCNRLQLIIYSGMLFYFILAVKKDSSLPQHLLAITVIGGFFFSIIWEAKSRYIFVYYVMMFPLAAIGYLRLLETLAAAGSAGGQEEEQEDDEIPIRKTA